MVEDRVDNLLSNTFFEIKVDRPPEGGGGGGGRTLDRGL